jgi:hypothetical protein
MRAVLLRRRETRGRRAPLRTCASPISQGESDRIACGYAFSDADPAPVAERIAIGGPSAWPGSTQTALRARAQPPAASSTRFARAHAP